MNRRWLFFIICILSLSYFIWKVKKADLFNSPIAGTITQPKSLKLIEERIRLQKDNSNSTNTNTPDKSVTVRLKEIKKNLLGKDSRSVSKQS